MRRVWGYGLWVMRYGFWLMGLGAFTLSVSLPDLTQVAHQPADLANRAGRETVESVESSLIDVALIEGHVKLAFDCSSGSFCDGKKVTKGDNTVSFETLCDVGGDSDTSFSNLVSKGKIFRESAISRDLIDFACQFAAFLPGLDVLKALKGSHDPVRFGLAIQFP